MERNLPFQKKETRHIKKPIHRADWTVLVGDMKVVLKDVPVIGDNPIDASLDQRNMDMLRRHLKQKLMRKKIKMKPMKVTLKNIIGHEN